MFHFGSSSRYSGFFVFTLFFLFACAATNRATNVQDTLLTLAVMPFQVGVNNSVFFLGLQTYEKKIAGF